jgi:nucleoside-triphosphatase
MNRYNYNIYGLSNISHYRQTWKILLPIEDFGADFSGIFSLLISYELDNIRCMERDFSIMQSTKNILITGLPGSGKTTLVIKLAEALQDLNPVGCYTAEIRKAGVRQGFELVSLDGTRAILSHVDIHSLFRVGRYGVDIKGLDSFLDSLALGCREAGLIIIDEIGKMESRSDRFKALMRELLNSDTPVLATIALKGVGFIDEVRMRADVRLVELTQTNRDSLVEDISEEMRVLVQRKDQQ